MLSPIHPRPPYGTGCPPTIFHVKQKTGADDRFGENRLFQSKLMENKLMNNRGFDGQSSYKS